MKTRKKKQEETWEQLTVEQDLEGETIAGVYWVHNNDHLLLEFEGKKYAIIFPRVFDDKDFSPEVAIAEASGLAPLIEAGLLDEDDEYREYQRLKLKFDGLGED